ncbi:TonB-dependent receptor plug domain-containing protein [Lewinella sp. 4G2]|uniref:TonB-dependent receptor n=1 Tax=Lewinella sp. 4G2 TaxID=1803372 RepID=UPI0007B4D7F0|nr:TonB-dependent receptor plug domain-containing protein [Lewinella sp. 4G2]OAV43672.1 TonB-dependent receptor [Lewinella sp. 4G2]
MRSFSRLILLLSLAFTATLNAQSHAGHDHNHPVDRLNGRVVDEASRPVIGAYVIHVGHEHHAHTNELGYFTLDEVDAGDSIMISYLGYLTQTVLVPNQPVEIEIRMREGSFNLNEVVIRPGVEALNVITSIDLAVRPVASAQEVLRSVPGLVIGQHAGGGKAEQIFLRGFDVDHGTDVAISVDGLPVNMVSHAHGQGYADLHFIIPETIEKIDFGKGPYYADVGNFNTAGYVNFALKERLESSSAGIEYGSFNTRRLTSLIDVLSSDNHNAYLATAYTLTDGPFDSSQHFSRFNVMGKYTGVLRDKSKVSLLASHFTSKWDASGQIPVRAVESGLIGRFGAIDDTEGGYTSRTNVAVNYNKVVDRNTFVKTSAFYSRYDFELFSNFTFFLEDPVNGDQIRQREERDIFGLSTELNKAVYVADRELLIKSGVGLRYDNSDDNGLANTINRTTERSFVQQGDIDESNLFGYVNGEMEFGNLLINTGLRFDYFQFNYVDGLATLYDRQEQTASRVSPKLNFMYNANNELQLFLKTGIGFHSNDTRVVLDNSADDILPAAYGGDLGFIYRPTPGVIVNAALWALLLDQEFVYVGDAGIVEPSGETRRLGVDFGVRAQLARGLFADLDVNYAFARSTEELEGEDYIPLAPPFTSTGGLSYKSDKWTAGLRYRYLADRPANEDNSIVAKGYGIVDANLNYRIGAFTIGLEAQNLLDTEWEETQFATESRLFNETSPTEEIHFTPGAPFFLRAIGRVRF